MMINTTPCFKNMLTYGSNVNIINVPIRETINIPINDPLPPSDGPSIMMDGPIKKDSGENIKAPKQLVGTNMNRANASWYDTIYHGGMLTMLPRNLNLHGSE
jgi:hypothetical protein